jgi:hypothetical protein
MVITLTLGLGSGEPIRPLPQMQTPEWMAG